MLDALAEFFSHPVFTVRRGIITLISAISLICITCLTLNGLLPALYRLGNSLANRKIVIVGDIGDCNEVENVLKYSKLFRDKNIYKISHSELDHLAGKSLIILAWSEDGNELLDKILDKKGSASLIIYAPSYRGRIGSDSMNEISKASHAMVVNHRGRLLNDLLATMMSTPKND